jgi:hypothetical protein
MSCRYSDLFPAASIQLIIVDTRPVPTAIAAAAAATPADAEAAAADPAAAVADPAAADVDVSAAVADVLCLYASGTTRHRVRRRRKRSLFTSNAAHGNHAPFCQASESC